MQLVEVETVLHFDFTIFMYLEAKEMVITTCVGYLDFSRYPLEEGNPSTLETLLMRYTPSVLYSQHPLSVTCTSVEVLVLAP